MEQLLHFPSPGVHDDGPGFPPGREAQLFDKFERDGGRLMPADQLFELGVDAAAYTGRAWDSFHYGLREARMTQAQLEAKAREEASADDAD